MIFEVFLLCATLSLSFFLYVKRAHTYWAKNNVPYIESTSIWGSMESPFKIKHGLKFDIKNSYSELKRRGLKHGGIYLFTRPIYIPVDLELIKCVLSKDFDHFIGRGLPIDEKTNPLAAHLFSLEGEKWKNMRAKLTPTFTSGKMKQMFNTLLQCGDPMIEHIENLCKNGAGLDVKEIFGCYTTDVIGSCVFGLECNSFKNPNAEFRMHGRKVLKPGLRTLLIQFFAFVIPGVVKTLGLRILPQDVETFFINAIQNILDYRTAKGVKRNDFINLLLEIQEKARQNNQELLTLEQIAAQSFVFFVAGFETSSSTITLCLHELAFNQDIQDKLRAEIKETMKKYDGKLTYDGIMQMKYLDQVIKETLRKYPIVPHLVRRCNMDYKVPNTDAILRTGTAVFVSILGLHMDEEYYPYPEKFDPERFSDENKNKIPQFAYLPFGEGPRVCIGLRFGVMQTKTGLSMVLNNYRILPVEGDKYNFEFDPKINFITKKGTLRLRMEKIE